MVKDAVLNTAALYLQMLPHELGVQRAFLFGACARGSDDENSDIDIALVISDMDDPFATQMQLMRLRRSIDLRIEPHPIREIDFVDANPFAYEIQKTGIDITSRMLLD